MKLQKSQELHLIIVQVQLEMKQNIGHDKELPKQRYII